MQSRCTDFSLPVYAVEHHLPISSSQYHLGQATRQRCLNRPPYFRDSKLKQGTLTDVS